MKHRITCTLAAVTVSSAASAGLTGVDWEDVSADIGTPCGFRTFRFYAVFDDPTDQLLAISGNQDVAGLFFSTDAPAGLVNDGGVFSGFKQEDFAAFPVSAPWDSWVTIGGDTFANQQTNYSPGFAGSDGIHNVIKGTEFSEANHGGWFDGDPSTPETGGSILIAQFTIAEGYELILEGTVDYYPGGSPPSSSEFFEVMSRAWQCDETVKAEHVSTSPLTDLDGSGATDFGDLLAVLSAWGPCAPSFEITAQDRWFRHVFAYCNCTGTWTIADGFGSWDHASGSQYVHTTVRDDGVSLDGTAHFSQDSLPCSEESARGGVQFQFQVNVPLPFTFVADAEPDGEAGDISLTGPGLHLTDPIDTAGILAPGQYVLDAALHVDFDCNYYCDADFDCDLVLDGTRCAADIDRSGVVDWLDLLQVLSEWGLTVQPGACCLLDGSCAEAVAYDDCVAAGGEPAGWGIRCDIDPCASFVACCLIDGTCYMTTEPEECLAACGTPQGAGSTCANVVCSGSGACCLPDGACVQSSGGGAACAAEGGVYLGFETVCEDVTCPQPGACCLPDGTCVQSNVGGGDCAAQGGVYHGDETLGADVVCIQPGACCLPDGSCVQSMYGAACLASGGVYYGEGTLCTDVVCLQPGACCLPDGSCIQSDVGGSACAIQGGVYSGDETLCADVVCPQPGACCLPDGTCVQSDVGGDDCAAQGGVYQGDETICADLVCPLGACCFPDWTCAFHTEESCENAGGTFAGGQTTCATVNCAQGACCLPDGSCVVIPLFSCNAVGGTYQGGGSACEEVICP